MTTALIICIPLTAVISGFLVLKTTQLTLRWYIQFQLKQQPTMYNPIKEAVVSKQADEVNKQTAEIFNEWVNGVSK